MLLALGEMLPLGGNGERGSTLAPHFLQLFFTLGDKAGCLGTDVTKVACRHASERDSLTGLTFSLIFYKVLSF